MRQPPPVSLNCEDRGVWHAVQVVLPALAAAVTAGWLALWAGVQPEAAAVIAAVAAAVVGAGMWKRSAPVPVLLQWTGEHWAANGEPGKVDLMLDLGGWMLLRWRAAKTTRWLPVTGAPLLLRAALHARQSARPATLE